MQRARIGESAQTLPMRPPIDGWVITPGLPRCLALRNRVGAIENTEHGPWHYRLAGALNGT
jgi:hypothetical protein